MRRKARVYPAESDPRQVVDDRIHPASGRLLSAAPIMKWDVSPKPMMHSEPWKLAREFGPWVRGADGRWERDRRKR